MLACCTVTLRSISSFAASVKLIDCELIMLEEKYKASKREGDISHRNMRLLETDGKLQDGIKIFYSVGSHVCKEREEGIW